MSSKWLVAMMMLVLLAPGLAGCKKDPVGPGPGNGNGSGNSGGSTPTEYTLTVRKEGTGSGRTTPEFGYHKYSVGAQVNIKATADAGSVVDGWSTGCSGANCSLSMDQDKTVTVKFSRVYPDLQVVGEVNPSRLFTVVLCGLPIPQNSPAIKVTNAGRALISKPVKVNFGVWDGQSSTYWIVKQWSDFTNGHIMDPGTTYQNGSFTFSLPCSAPAGRYYYVVVADPGNTIEESNEGNNLGKGSASVMLLHRTVAGVEPAAAEAISGVNPLSISLDSSGSLRTGLMPKPAISVEAQ